MLWIRQQFLKKKKYKHKKEKKIDKLHVIKILKMYVIKIKNFLCFQVPYQESEGGKKHHGKRENICKSYLR